MVNILPIKLIIVIIYVFDKGGECGGGIDGSSDIGERNGCEKGGGCERGGDGEGDRGDGDGREGDGGGE